VRDDGQLRARTAGGLRGRRRRRRPTLAERADKYDLYERAVQDPEGDVMRVRRMFARAYGRPPRTLREDFCGTAAFATAWVAAHGESRAIGVDLDPEPLAWGRRTHLAGLRPERAARVALVQGDVRSARTGKVDVTVAFNFSFFLLRTRPELLAYFRHVRAGLREQGMFVLDIYGGPESIERREERRRCGGFTYVWDQDRFDPITHDALCHIHFEFRDGSRLWRAFSYDWRLWTVPELRDLLADAGFAGCSVYWEGTERGTLEPNGVFREREHAEEDPAWITYLVARR
jgi:SAM-dependent methyltransferase